MIALNGAGTVPATGGKAALRCLGTQTFAYFNKPSITETKVETSKGCGVPPTAGCRYRPPWVAWPV